MSPLNLKRHFDIKEKKTFWVYQEDPDHKLNTSQAAGAVGQNDMKYATTIPDELVIFVPSGKYSIHDNYQIYSYSIDFYFDNSI